MLCDQIIASEHLRQAYIGFEPIQDKVRRAQKFVLAADFAHAADGLVDNYVELERVLPYCRLPYPLCWIEVAQADRPNFSAAPIVSGDRVSRIGFLLEQDGRSSRWKTYLMWSMVNKAFDLNACWMAMLYDTEKAVSTNETALGRAMVPMPGEFHSALLALMPGDEKMAQGLVQLAINDWAGETRFLIAALGLFNARNVAETQIVDNTTLNCRRVKRGKAPLASHTVLKIRAAHKGVRGKGSRETDPAGVRAHFVRSHFKRRRSGIFWWGPHMRGKLELGFVNKDYEVH